MKIKISKGQCVHDWTEYTVKRVFGKVRVTGVSFMRHNPTPFFGTVEDAILYCDNEGFDLVAAMESNGWNTEK